MLEKLQVVAKEIIANLPVKDLTFNPKSVEELVPVLQDLIAKEHMSKNWVDGVYDASKAGYPVVIDFDGENWSFHSYPDTRMTRDELVVELAEVYKQMKKGNVKWVDSQGKELKMNRADRRARRFNH